MSDGQLVAAAVGGRHTHRYATCIVGCRRTAKVVTDADPDGGRAVLVVQHALDRTDLSDIEPWRQRCNGVTNPPAAGERAVGGKRVAKPRSTARCGG